MASKEEKEKLLEELSPNEIWRIYLNEGMPGIRKRAPVGVRMIMALQSGFFKILPSDPRCMLCFAPFSGAGAPLMKAVGRGQSNLNPNLCIDCEHVIQENNGGAEVDLTILFADVRGSTKLAENKSPSEFSQIINQFYTISTEKLIMANALIDKLIGDEVTAFFVPGMAGSDHPSRAIEAAKEVLVATGHADPDGPWVPVGIGIHTGVAYVGVVGNSDGLAHITVLGDVANTGSRLASVAHTGEIIASTIAIERAKIDTHDLEMRVLELKGKSGTLDAWVVKVDSQPEAREKSSAAI